MVSHVALTTGEWEVVKRPLWIDMERQLVYFMGLRESPLEKHLYVVSLRRPGEVRLLTRPGFSYVVEFNSVSEMRRGSKRKDSHTFSFDTELICVGLYDVRSRIQ